MQVLQSPHNSATLTNATSGSLEEQYSYFIRNTGFPAGERGCLSEPKPSPYPYDEHAMIYYCDDLPHPTREHEAFIEKGVEQLLEILSLSNVIIFRLPFPVPDPIIEYKCSVSTDALMDVRVPEMIIKLKQGIGRLIRNFTDTDIVCIIDRRLRDEPPERYHDITWDSLPIKNRTSSLDELRKFYEGLPSAKE